MTDLSQTIAPKSDQLNADDLIAGPRTITVTRVSANPSTAEQPIAVNYEGDNGKPWFPCKSMRRVMVYVWGKDGAPYVGRSLTLFRDPAVKFGGLEVGGIRISHMTDISEPVTMALTATRANRKPFTVKPLAAPKAEKAAKPRTPVDEYAVELGAHVKAGDMEALAKFWAETEDRRAALNIPQERLGAMAKAVNDAFNAAANAAN